MLSLEDGNMLSREFVKDDYNPATVEPGFKKEKWYKGRYLLKAEARERSDDIHDTTKGLIITVYDTESKSTYHDKWGIASARFILINDHMEVSMVQVSSDYRRQGIASAMYNFARELGNDIMPSKSQTVDGKAFWASGAGAVKNTQEQLPIQKTVAVTPEKPEKKQSFFRKLFKI